MRVAVDFGKCTGLGMCEAIAPDFFEIQEDGTLKLLAEHCNESQRAEIEEAIAACPTEAISILEG